MSRNLMLVVMAFASVFSHGCSKPDTAPGIIMLRYTTGSESTEQRERGFLDTIKKEYPQIKILSSDQYAQTTVGSSVDKATDLITKYGDRIQGVFAVCEPNAQGTLNALEEAGLTDKVKFVGFDPNSNMVTALGENKMQGIVLQDPVQMGYMAVKTLVEHLEGKKVEKRISTGEYVATPANMKEEKMKMLLAPPQTDTSPEVKDAKYRIAVIPKGTTHEFWKSIHFGASKAAKELGNVQILYRGPSKEGNTESQINLVQDLIAQEVDGICLAPNDSSALVTPVEESKKKGIPVVVFDSGLQGSKDNYVSYVATDNYNGGVLAAHCLAESLGYKRKDADKKSSKEKGSKDKNSKDKKSKDKKSKDESSKDESSKEKASAKS